MGSFRSLFRTILAQNVALASLNAKNQQINMQALLSSLGCPVAVFNDDLLTILNVEMFCSIKAL